MVEYCVKAESDGFLLGTRTQKCLISAYLRLECFSEAMLVLDVIEREEVQVESGVLSVLQPYRDVRDALRLNIPATAINNSNKDNVNDINDVNKNNTTVDNKNINDENSEKMKIGNMEDRTISKENKIKFLNPSEYRNQNMARFDDPNIKVKEKEKEELFFGLDLFCFVILMTSSSLRKNIVNPRPLNSTSTSVMVRALYLRVILNSIRCLSDTETVLSCHAFSFIFFCSMILLISFLTFYSSFLFYTTLFFLIFTFLFLLLTSRFLLFTFSFFRLTHSHHQYLHQFLHRLCLLRKILTLIK